MLSFSRGGPSYWGKFGVGVKVTVGRIVDVGKDGVGLAVNGVVGLGFGVCVGSAVVAGGRFEDEVAAAVDS